MMKDHLSMTNSLLSYEEIRVLILPAFLKDKILGKFPVLSRSRTSRSQIFFKIGVLKNFAIFIGKHLCWSLFLIKLQT